MKSENISKEMLRRNQDHFARWIFKPKYPPHVSQLGQEANSQPRGIKVGKGSKGSFTNGSEVQVITQEHMLTKKRG